MIVGERKPFEDIMETVAGYEKLLILGCGTCVSVCMAGGEKEVELLATQVRMANQLQDKNVVLGEATVQRQCDREFVEPILEKAKSYDAVLSMACGAGVQFVADMLEPIPVVPALDTRFIGVTLAEGVWAERCRACGSCMLAAFGGICPLTMCAKSLVNGPCGGYLDGKCEVDRQRDCAWVLIFQRLEKLGQKEKLRTLPLLKDYSKFRHPRHTTLTPMG